MKQAMEVPKQANIYQKMAKARVMLQNSKLNKSGNNKFANYKYFELQDFLPRLNEICDQFGMFSKFYFDQVQKEDQEPTAYLTFYNVENIKDHITFTIPVKEATIKGAGEIQNLGGTNTYLKRYLYMNALEIAENDIVDGGEPNNNPNPQPKTQPKAQPKQEPKQERSQTQTDLITYINGQGLDVNKVAQKTGLNKQSTDDDYLKVLKMLVDLTPEQEQEYKASV